MKPFHMLYQPKFQNENLVSIEALLRINNDERDLESYIKAYSDPVKLDRFVITKVAKDINKIGVHNIDVPISMNVSYHSLTNNQFITFCIETFKHRHVYLELTEHFFIHDVDLLSKNIAILRKNNIKVSLDDFGKDFSRSNLLVRVKFDQVKIDKSLTKDITTNFCSFKHLVFLTEKITQFGITDIVYEGIEIEKQKKLIELFNQEPIFQGFYFEKPTTLEKIIEKRYKVNKVKKKNPLLSNAENLEKLIYELVLSEEDQKINEQIKKYDLTKLIYNKNAKKTITNFQEIFYSNHDKIVLNSIKTIMDNSNRMIVIRNCDGVVIFENKLHSQFFGISTVGIDKDTLITIFPDYRRCLEDDYSFMNSSEFFAVSKEVFDGINYVAMRQKAFFNDSSFIFNSVSEEETGSIDYRDPLTGCYMRDFLNNFKRNKIHFNKVLAYIDLDGFKLINDTLGHKIGDECLVDFVSLLSVNLRTEVSDDKVIRVGGDEFLILINSSDVDAIQKKIFSFRVKLEKFFKAKNIDLSFSFGVEINTFNDIELAIDSADRKMYEDKRQRRKTKLLHRENIH